MRRIRILDLWFFRGLFYFYVGFITLGNDATFTMANPQDIAALAQVSMGAFYCLMVSGVSEGERETESESGSESEGPFRDHWGYTYLCWVGCGMYVILDGRREPAVLLTA